jgi:hypothetical protein
MLGRSVYRALGEEAKQELASYVRQPADLIKG